ncbi:hypothetical protein BJ166DRAFT_534548 [Pestalotiopsis sp. NC0098]|nr:hypothetical protein BJ166DRAFT_534548 [Pestalotiopsis sp. NC0098]
MESKTSRYQSRILREMHQNKENPFNSPPSSTGSHGTVTLTSDISYSPEGESTRRMGGDDSIMLPGLSNKHSARGGAPDTPFKVNTSAIGQDFPEYQRAAWDADETDDIYNVTGDYEKQQRKENIPPSSSTVNSPSQIEARKASLGASGTRAHMQARVEDDSDHSGSIHSTMSAGSGHKKRATFKPQRGNVTALIQTLKAAQSVQDSAPKRSSSQNRGSERRTSGQRPSRLSEVHMSPAPANQTARSFFLPNMEHINDLVSGTLKLSTAKNGIPVFVKHGKVHDRESKVSSNLHAELDAIEVPRDEQEIFVSLDKIREEIYALQSHDDQVSKQAEQLQDEICELQIQLLRYKSRKDSAMGSDSDGSVVDYLHKEKSQLEEKVVVLQAKLEKANRKISINEIHTDSYVTERDEALKSATAYAEKISSLQAQLDASRNELNAIRGGAATGDSGQSLREDNIALRSQYKTMLEENRSLRSQNASITQQYRDLQHETKRLQRLLDAALEDREILKKELDNMTEQHHGLEVDHVSLERHNEKYYAENKSLQQKISLLERRIQDLQDNNGQLHDMLDAANANTGTMTFDIQDIRNRFEKKNVILSNENAQLQQQIIELREDYSEKRVEFEQEKRLLVSENKRWQNKLDRMSQSFERVIQESRKEFEEQRESLTQQLDEVVVREAALANQLKATNGKEMQNLPASASKSKPVKVTRILEPTTTRSRSTFSEVSAKSTTDHLGTQEREDFTQQFDLTQDSDLDLLPRGEMDKLRDALRQDKSGNQQNGTEEHAVDEAEGAMTPDDSQSLPPQFLSQAQRETPSKVNPVSGKRLPSGILKNTATSQRGAEQDLTGRFSVKSGMSGMSLPSQGTRSDVFVNRRHSDSDRFNIDDADVDENMESALFMDDITLDSRKRAAQLEKNKESSKTTTESRTNKVSKRPIATLSTEAKRVLDGLCHDHDCRNCIMCVRINAHRHQGETQEVGKKTITVERPVPVTDRIPNPVSSDADITMRPAQQPGIALATVLKGLNDELAHIVLRISRKNDYLNGLDPSFARRQRKQVSSELQRLMRLRDVKQDQIYRMHDVIEGQKQAGQQMTQAECDVTVASVTNMLGEETWDGILDDF